MCFLFRKQNHLKFRCSSSSEIVDTVFFTCAKAGVKKKQGNEQSIRIGIRCLLKEIGKGCNRPILMEEGYHVGLVADWVEDGPARRLVSCIFYMFKCLRNVFSSTSSFVFALIG